MVGTAQERLCPPYETVFVAASVRSAMATQTTINAAASRHPAYDGRLRLWAKGFAFSRRVMRTGVPGRSKASRIELMR